MCLCICVYTKVWVSLLSPCSIYASRAFFVALHDPVLLGALTLFCDHDFLNVFPHIRLQGPRCIGGWRAGSLGVQKTCTEGYVIFRERNPQMLAMSLHWEGKECLPAFKVLPFSFPQQNQILRSHAHSYKRKLILYRKQKGPGTEVQRPEFFESS